jgi:hypothetical protein
MPNVIMMEGFMSSVIKLYDTVSYCHALCRLTECFGFNKDIPVSSSVEGPETGRAR